MKTALLVLILAVAVHAWAQQAPDLSVNVNVVSLFATVRDHDGRLLNNLTSDDFTLQEDGTPQEIRYFSKEADLPLTIGLLVDTSRSQVGVLPQESSASYKFLDQVLRDGKDQAFIVHFDDRVQTLQGLTSSHSLLAAALGPLKIPESVATVLYSAIGEASDNVMRKQPGRKALILLTDGVAYKDPISLGPAIDAAQRADTIIYAIRYSDSVRFNHPLRGLVMAVAKQRGKRELKRMARETGGVSYEVTETQTIEAIYAQIEDSLRNQYSIGYTPKRAAPDGKYHKLKLTAKDRRLTVATRDGYFAR